LVAVLYPIGYTLLVARLAISYTHSLTAAWYAASLVPAPNVLGQVFGLPLLLSIGSATAVLIVEQLPRPPWHGRSLPAWATGTRGLILSVIVVLVAIVVGIIAREFALLVGIVAGGATGFVSGWLQELKKARRISALTRWGALGSFLYVLLTVMSLLPPPDPASVLPQVDLAGVHIAGARLLAHTDGYWYVFGRDGVLHAVPDSQAGQATIRP